MIKTIEVTTARDECAVDIDMLHSTLLELPAKKYLHLYYLMRDNVENGGVIKINNMESRLI